MRKETKKKEKKQFEPDGTWNKKNMCSKNKQEEREKHKENTVKKEKEETNKWKNTKKKTKNERR